MQSQILLQYLLLQLLLIQTATTIDKETNKPYVNSFGNPCIRARLNNSDFDQNTRTRIQYSRKVDFV